MEHCHGAAGLDLLDNENGAARDGAAEEFPVGGDGVGLVSGSEMFSCYAQEDRGHVAAIGDWEKMVLDSGLLTWHMSGVYTDLWVYACNIPVPTQKLGDRFASNVLSSSLLMALSCSRDAGICTWVLIVSVVNLKLDAAPWL